MNILDGATLTSAPVCHTSAISPEDLKLFCFADSPEEAFESLNEGLTRYRL
ncbi:MAG TPA: hypothetical protein VIX19_09655 [Terriglobales bacterium]